MVCHRTQQQFFFETVFHIVPQLAMELINYIAMLTYNLWQSFCLNLFSVRIIGVSNHIQLTLLWGEL